MKKYKVFQKCYDFPNDPPYYEELSVTSPTKERAEICMYCCAIDELELLNGIMEDGEFPERRFIATMEDVEFDIVIHAWDGPDYRPVTCYKVMEVDELVEFFNEKLRNKHGDKITVQIHSYEEDDGSTCFYYTSAKYGDSDAFPTVSAAYDSADDYLCGVGEIY